MIEAVTASHNTIVVARVDRAIQYVEASRHYRWRLWIRGRPVKPGDDSGDCFAYSGLIPANFATLPHFSVSAST